MNEDRKRMLDQELSRQREAWSKIKRLELRLGKLFTATMVLFPPLIKYSSSSGAAYSERWAFWGPEFLPKMIFAPEKWVFIDLSMILFGMLAFAVACFAVNAVFWLKFDTAKSRLIGFEPPVPAPDAGIARFPKNQDEGSHA